MRAAEEITGEAAAVERIATFLQAGDTRICALVGPAGSGKTSVAGQVISRLTDDFEATIWRGNALTASTSEAILASSQAKGSEGRLRGVALDFAEDFGNLLLEGHVPFSKTIRNIIGWSTKSAKQRSLSPARQNFLYAIALSGRKRKSSLVVCDDLHYWDNQSLDFLAQVSSGLWTDIYPALGNAKFLLIWTPEHARPGFMAHVKRKFGTDISVQKLALVSKHDFRELLIAFGARSDLPANVYESVYAVCHGHLAFATQTAALLRQSSSGNLKITNWHDLDQSLFEILSRRLDELPEVADSVRKLTEAISVLGEALHMDDLFCLFRDTDLRLPGVLQRAEELGLVREAHKLVRISHEAIQTVIAKHVPDDRKRWHAKFAACLRELRPAAYEKRALHHLQGGEFDLADTMRAHAILARVRQGEIAPGDGWATKANVKLNPVSTFLQQVEAAAEKEQDRRYAEAIAILHTATPPKHGAGEFNSLAAERDVLLARLYLMLRDDHSRAFALELCEQWEMLESECELWARIMETRLVVLSHLRRHEEGREIERQLLVKYHERKKFDPDASFAEARLKRKAEAIHSPRIANRMMTEALEFFDPDGSGETPRDPVEYVITLNNLGANELVLSQFESALSRFKKAAAIVERTSPTLIRRGELILSNLVVAHFMKTQLVSPIVGEIERIILPLSVRHSDVGLLRSNLACLAAYKNDIKGAHDRLQELWREISAIDGFSRYSVYFVGSNYAVASGLLGQNAVAGETLGEVQRTVASLPIDMQPYALRRIRMLREVFETTGHVELAFLQLRLQTGRAEVGESWPFYGQPFALTDLQFWTES